MDDHSISDKYSRISADQSVSSKYTRLSATMPTAIFDRPKVPEFCAFCRAVIKTRAVHLLKCHKHGSCTDCYSTHWKGREKGPCAFCSGLQSRSLPAFKLVEAVTPNPNNRDRKFPMVAFSDTRRVQSAKPKISAINIDYNRGLDPCTSSRTPVSVTRMWKSHKEGDIAMIQSGKAMIYIVDQYGKRPRSCNIQGMRCIIDGLVISDKTTALIVAKTADSESQLGIYDLTSCLNRTINPRLLRLFSPDHPSQPTMLFDYTEETFGVYSSCIPPNIKIMNKNNYIVDRSFEIKAKYTPDPLDMVSFDHTNERFLVSSYADNKIVIIDENGGTLKIVGENGASAADYPGYLHFPQGVSTDSVGNLLVANRDGSLHLYCYGYWSILKESEKRGRFLTAMLATSKYLYVATGMQQNVADSLSIFRYL